MKKALWIFAALVMMCGATSVNAQNTVQPYFTTDELPNLIKCLPAPPDTLSEHFVHDIMRHCMNAIVHPAVKEHLGNWLTTLNSPIAFAETALPRESGLPDDAQTVWMVDAPIEVRVQRVMRRNGIMRAQVLERIAAQACEFSTYLDAEKINHSNQSVSVSNGNVVTIINDNNHSLITQITQALTLIYI